MSKKAQLSLFLILGLVVMIAFGFINYLLSINPKSAAYREKETFASSSLPSDLYPVKFNIDLCMQDAAYEAVSYIGFYGGYYQVPEPKTSYLWEDIPLYALDGWDIMPSKETIEKGISQYVADNLPRCISRLKFDDLKIEKGAISANAIIGKEKIIVNAHYPLAIFRHGAETKLADFRAEVPVRLDTIYNIALNITNEQIANHGALCADCLINLADENDVRIDVLIHEGSSIIFTIFDNNSIIGNSGFVYNFATE